MRTNRGPGLFRLQWPALPAAVSVAALLGWSTASAAPRPLSALEKDVFPATNTAIGLGGERTRDEIQP